MLYGNPVADKRDSTTELTYYLINRKQVNHCPHVRGNERINRITGEGVYFNEICKLYNKTFGETIEDDLKGIEEIIKIEYEYL